MSVTILVERYGIHEILRLSNTLSTQTYHEKYTSVFINEGMIEQESIGANCKMGVCPTSSANTGPYRAVLYAGGEQKRQAGQMASLSL